MMTSFASQMEQLSIQLAELREMKANRRELLQKHCEFLREDVDIAVESKCEEARQQGDEMHKRIDAYEQERLRALDDEQREAAFSDNFEETMREAAAFRDK